MRYSHMHGVMDECWIDAIDPSMIHVNDVDSIKDYISICS
jgi:hypothetical protein